MTAPLSQEELWRRYDALEARLTSPVSERLLDLARLAPGQRVLDLGAGRGEPALRAARRVGPAGHVLGVDNAAPLLELARDQARQSGLTNLGFRAAAAESLGDLEAASFHAVTARWSLMYMADPVAALRHARRALIDSGVLVAAFWGEPDRVPYYTLPRQLLARFRPVPSVDSEVPGTFRYASIERIARDLAHAGFVLDHVEEMSTPVFESANPAEVVAWATALGLGALVAELPELSRLAWESDFARELEAHRSGGVIRLGGVTRLIRATPAPATLRSRQPAPNTAAAP